RVIAVTVLTSLDRGDLELLVSAVDPAGAVPRLAKAAMDAGLAGAVCSPLEASAVRRECGGGFLIVTPGIRPGGSPAGDQKRVATAAEAVLAGADVLVVGRPVTGAPDPGLAAAALLEEIGAALEERHAGNGPA
ncbi:orotidine-5'-phosphate decarboxylase, partial [Candidatus Fermentibacteria bacterium]|nr:orotidine-5'-phosphate decarboxylase [Candidatus Fermentibacteria bacterium]